MIVSARLALPLLAPGQAQKELFHNEALQSLDVIVQGVVEDAPANDPPAAPTIGATYLVGLDPLGAWSGHALAVACWTEGGWRFHAPFEGLELALRRTGLKVRFSGGNWQIGRLDASVLRIDGEQVISARRPGISGPAGGTVIDNEARTTPQSVLGALRAHGLIAAN